MGGSSKWLAGHSGGVQSVGARMEFSEVRGGERAFGPQAPGCALGARWVIVHAKVCHHVNVSEAVFTLVPSTSKL